MTSFKLHLNVFSLILSTVTSAPYREKSMPLFAPVGTRRLPQAGRARRRLVSSPPGAARRDRVLPFGTTMRMDAMTQRPPVPPFTPETAAQKIRAAEDAWNSRDPERVAGAY